MASTRSFLSSSSSNLRSASSTSASMSTAARSAPTDFAPASSAPKLRADHPPQTLHLDGLLELRLRLGLLIWLQAAELFDLLSVYVGIGIGIILGLAGRPTSYDAFVLVVLAIQFIGILRRFGIIGRPLLRVNIVVISVSSPSFRPRRNPNRRHSRRRPSS